ncbi:extracellular solute-binding protein [Brachybacterium sp. YJGR34]|uniref:extracellular solute-binding protein n=1 Tax=Brachybacterium sp. YJGR34 TaxID=2059911 RepID=UPI001E3506F5|nr:extracellular solute-binding protein [Brachybacterium sp. YJGR34]
MPTRRQLLLSSAALGLAGAGTLAGCGGDQPVELEEGETLRMRVWSEAAATAYEASLREFTADTGLEVDLEVLGWDAYWEQLPLDVAAESLPDVLWMNTANLAQAHASGQLLEVGEIAGGDAGAWEAAATDLYRLEDGLWGVPQIWEQTVLVSHRGLVGAVDGDPEELLADPGAGSDTLRDLARALTVDDEGRHPGDEGFDPAGRLVHGFSAHPDRTALLGPFIAGQGGTWQDEEGAFTFGSAQGIAAVQYLADMAAEHLAPSGAATVGDPDLCLDLFAGGKLGLLQTGTYDLSALAEAIDGAFEWTLHPPVAGPEGSRPLVHAVAAVGIDPGDDDRRAAVGELLSWLGGVEGQRPLAENRLGIPGHRDLRGAWEGSWSEAGVDVSVLRPAPEDVARPELGNRSAEGTGTALPIIAEVFTGDATAEDALPRAQDEANGVLG